MPVVRQLRVIVGDRKDGLKNGDTVTIKGTSGVVQGQRELQTNMEVTFSTGHKRRVPLGSEINVLRAEQTEDERLNDELTRFNEKCSKKWSSLQAGLEYKHEKMNQRYQERLAAGVTAPFDLDDAADLARFQEDYALWESVRHWCVEGQPVAVPGTLMVRAVLIVRQHCLDRLTRSHRNSLSRSTSVVSNLQEDLRLDAAASFLDDTKWFDAEALLDRLTTRHHQASN